jgi:hypothetical protein
MDFVVAKGIPPILGKNGYIELKYKNSGHKQDGQLILQHEVESVEKGDVVAQLISPESGTTGTDIYGEIVAPGNLINTVLKAGTGCELTEDGNRAIAKVSGKPILKGNTISVSPTYTLNHDIDMKIGNIKFKGDLTINGNVLDGMSAEATGKVIVNGYVANARVIAGGDAVIQQNVVGATIRAGGIASICQRLLKNIESVNLSINAIPAVLRILKQQPMFQKNRDVEKLGDGVLLKVLFDTKYVGLKALSKDILGDLNTLKQQYDDPLIASTKEAYNNFTDNILNRIPLDLKTIDAITQYLQGFQEKMFVFLDFLRDKSTETSKVTVIYIQNSTIESSGDVIIKGRGSYSSNIYAGQHVNVQGVFKGGEIVAAGNVKITELGSETEVPTAIKVNKGNFIYCNTIHPGVRLKAGSRIEKITHRMLDYRLMDE